MIFAVLDYDLASNTMFKRISFFLHLFNFINKNVVYTTCIHKIAK